jgi:hypothetical protein
MGEATSGGSPSPSRIDARGIKEDTMTIHDITLLMSAAAALIAAIARLLAVLRGGRSP